MQRGLEKERKKERKRKKRKETFTEPSLFTFGEEVAWGPRGHRGFSSTARSEEERKLIHLTVEREEVAATKFVCKGGILYRFTPGERTPHAPSPGLANASTWKECNGLHLVRDLGVHGGDAAARRRTHL